MSETTPGYEKGGGGESLKGTQRTVNTQVSAPIACHHLQCSARQPPTLTGRVVPSGRLFPGSFTFASGGRGKREPYPYDSSSSCQTGQKEKKTTSASEQGELQRSPPAQNQTPTIQLTNQPPQVSEESWEDGESVAQECRSPPHASWSTLNLVGPLEKERPCQEEENTSTALLPPLEP